MHPYVGYHRASPFQSPSLWERICPFQACALPGSDGHPTNLKDGGGHGSQVVIPAGFLGGS